MRQRLIDWGQFLNLKREALWLISFSKGSQSTSVWKINEARNHIRCNRGASSRTQSFLVYWPIATFLFWQTLDLGLQNYMVSVECFICSADHFTFTPKFFLDVWGNHWLMPPCLCWKLKRFIFKSRALLTITNFCCQPIFTLVWVHGVISQIHAAYQLRVWQQMASEQRQLGNTVLESHWFS